MKHEHPALFSTGSTVPVLRSVHASGELNGLLLSMTLRQTFRNESADNLEVVYTFPLAWGAVLLGLEATLGGRRMTGKVLARTEARERYEDAVAQGDAPIMVERAQNGVFSASLGSLKPGEEAQIELSYAQLLSFEQGRIRLVVPTTIAPRFGDPIGEGGLSPDQVAAPDLMAEHGFSLTLRLRGPLARARIGSPTHAIAHQAENDAATVSLQGRAWLDRDFVLVLDDLEGQSFAVTGPDPQSAEGHAAVIASYCPALPGAAPSPLRLKILVDCSGSMAGDSIALARAALHPLVDQLAPRDQVSYSRFGSLPQRVLSFGSANEANARALIEAIEATDADLGGTELALALADTFALPAQDARDAGEADVLLITDGEVWGAERIVADAQRSGHRIYALGVGSAPAESLLREMAESTGGACEFVTPKEDMGAAVQRLLIRIRLGTPLLAQIESSETQVWCSPLPTRWIPAETVHVFMRLASMPAEGPSLNLDGKLALKGHLHRVDGDLVARLVAAREIALATDPSEARALAERYQLVTEHTNLLLVFYRAEGTKTDGMPDLNQVRPMVAAGWGGVGSVTLPAASRMYRGGIRALVAGEANLRFSVVSDQVLPSVWRSADASSRPNSEPLAWDDDLGSVIPAFLRQQPGSSRAPNANKTVHPTTPRKPASRSSPSTASPSAIIAAFNANTIEQQSFQQILRAVLALELATSLCKMIDAAANNVGGPVNAWACYLLWLHESGSPELRLTSEALTLVRRQINKFHPDSIAKCKGIFSDLNPINQRI